MELTIALCGDIMLGAEVTQYMGDATVTDWLEGVSRAWHDADLLIGNLECPCTVTAKPLEGPIPEIIFHASAQRLTELADAGFSAVTIANNHVLDCGAVGLFETIQGLDQAGIYHTGAGMNIEAALRPAFIPIRGLTVGLVAFCYGPPAGRSSPGVAPFEPEYMREGLSIARASADFVIAVLHDGIEYADVPPSVTRTRFRLLAENGADIVIGHHPHVLQGLEWYGQVPVAYSLGDLLFHNSLPHVAKRNFSRMAMGLYAPEEVQRDPWKFSRGAILTVRISEGQKSIQWHPFRQDANLRPQLSAGDTRAQDLRRLYELSTILLKKEDPCHALVDSVFETAWWESRDDLTYREVTQLLLRPKWRYITLGLVWLYRWLRRMRKPL